VQLTAENVKRLRAVTIAPDGNVVQITGRNGQGKSSVLDAIWYALGGKSSHCVEPIRRGEKSAKVTLNLGDLIVTRAWSANDKSAVTVQSKDGARYPSPQAILDKLVGDLTFDPLAFTRMKPAEQVETLKRLAGLDFADIDRKRQEAYDQRTERNREAKLFDAQLAQTTMHDLGDPLDAQAIKAELDAAVRELRMNDAKRRALADMRQEYEAAKERVSALDERIAALRNELLQAEGMRADMDDNAKEILRIGKIAADAAEKLVDPDINAIQAKMEAARDQHSKAEHNRRYSDIRGKAQDARNASDELTAAIAKLDGDKQRMVSDAKMPIDGLGLDGGRVTYQGMPFDQCSSAEQLRISVAIGSATNPKFRTMCVKDGSLLDKDSLRLLGELCEQHDLQVWLERVGDGDGVGVVIEDGQVSRG